MLLKAMDPTQNVTLDIIPGSTGDTVTIDYVTPNSVYIYGRQEIQFPGEMSLSSIRQSMAHHVRDL